MLQQPAPGSAFSSPLILRGKAHKERCKCKLTFASAHLTSAFCAQLPFGKGILFMQELQHCACWNRDYHQNVSPGLLKVTGFVILISPQTSQHKHPETAGVASGAVPWHNLHCLMRQRHRREQEHPHLTTNNSPQPAALVRSSLQKYQLCQHRQSTRRRSTCTERSTGRY